MGLKPWFPTPPPTLGVAPHGLASEQKCAPSLTAASPDSGTCISGGGPVAAGGGPRLVLCVGGCLCMGVSGCLSLGGGGCSSI